MRGAPQHRAFRRGNGLCERASALCVGNAVAATAATAKSLYRFTLRRQWIALAVVAGLVADVAVDRLVDESSPIVRETCRNRGRTLRHRAVLCWSLGQEVAAAGGVVRSFLDRSDVAGMGVLIALLKR